MTFLYDNTFKGLLSVVFESYKNKFNASDIIATQKFQPGFFTEVTEVYTDPVKAERVKKKLLKLDKTFFRKLYKVFLSEKPGREMLIYRQIRSILSNLEKTKSDYRDADVLRVKQIVKEIDREVHRMHAFVRFQRMADDIWFAPIEPDFDVVPLIEEHFVKRYADQKWLIYDVKRKYGLFYNLEESVFIELDLPTTFSAERLSEKVLHKDEVAYQQLWKEYFESVNIKARKNMKLHIKHVPKRYWKYLFEK